MPAPVIVFLVHGTFARGAGWTKADSPLCQAIEAATRGAKRDVVFRPVEWSGRNTSKARLDGARRLEGHFREACETLPAAPIFIVGHSHGGSVVAYFCRDLPDRLRERLTGAAFLSTPFIATRIRPDWRQLISGLGVAIALLVFTALAAFTSYLDFRYRWSYQTPIPPSVVALLASFCFASFVVAELARRATIGWGNRISKRFDAAIRIHETARLPAGRNIFLRATGDEAAAALAIGQFAIWLLGKLETLASRGIGQVWSHILRSRWLSAAAVVFAVLYAIWVGTEVAVALDEGFLWRNLFVKPSVPISVMSSFVEISIQVLAWPFVLLVLSMVLFVALLLAGILLCLVALRAAGWTGLRDGLFAEIAIEPVPLGEVSLNHLDWNVEEPRSSQRHGYSYSNPEALRRIAAWISQELCPDRSLESRTAWSNGSTT
jgi:pimeloyl-ACP methyl ester carboxylesterase